MININLHCIGLIYPIKLNIAKFLYNVINNLHYGRLFLRLL